MTFQMDFEIIQPGDVRHDKLIPNRLLHIVGRANCNQDGGEWWETEIGCIESSRIGELARREFVDDWEWVE